MNCPYCGDQNPANAKYCVNCGRYIAGVVLDTPGRRQFGAFSPGGHGDGYYSQTNLEDTQEAVLAFMNRPDMVFLFPDGPDRQYFLGEVLKEELHPDDSEKSITSRYEVLHWWKLVWSTDHWAREKHETAARPLSIGLSPLEGTPK